MLNHRHRRRDGERGQVLIMALAFILFFGVLIVSVLNYSSLTGRQVSNTEASAKADTGAEGGAAFAAADAGRGDSACPGAAITGTVRMADGSTVTYRGTGNRCHGERGVACLLCILGQGATALSSDVNLTVPGEIDVNGGISLTNRAALTAAPPPGRLRRVGVAGAVTGNGSINTNDPASPDPEATPIVPIADPLKSTYSPPSQLPTNEETCCTPLADGSYPPMRPGVYDSAIAATANATITLDPGASDPGIYVIESTWTVGTDVTFKTSGPVLIYLAQGGSINVATEGHLLLDDRSMSNNPDRVILYAQPTITSLITVAPQGEAHFAGSLDAPGLSVLLQSATGTVEGGPTGTTIDGRLVAGSLQLNDGNLIMTGTASPIDSCTVYDDAVVGASARVILQVGCTGGTGIINFNYGP